MARAAKRLEKFLRSFFQKATSPRPQAPPTNQNLPRQSSFTHFFVIGVIAQKTGREKQFDIDFLHKVQKM